MPYIWDIIDFLGIRHYSFHNSSTGLANRFYSTRKGIVLGVLVCDLEGLKEYKRNILMYRRVADIMSATLLYSVMASVRSFYLKN